MKRIDKSEQKFIVKDKRSYIVREIFSSFKNDFNVIRKSINKFNSIKELVKTDIEIIESKLLKVIIARESVESIFKILIPIQNIRISLLKRKY